MYQLRKANKDDYDFVFNLFKTVYKDYVIKFWSNRDEEFEKDFCENRFKIEIINIILDDKKAIGVLELIEKENQIYIEEIQVDPNKQGMGIGTEIITDVKNKALEMNYSVGLQVLKLNTRAKKLYEGLGFNVIGETESHYVMEA